jgi:uncharacterized SAM-binding protein YcdF (DUF218 family)
MNSSDRNISQRPGCLSCLPQTGCLAVSGSFGIVILLVVASILAELALTAVGGLIIIADPEQKVDAIVILSGGGTPRLKEAVRLREEGYATPIILTETGIITENFGSLSEIEKNQLVEMGVTPRDIFITELHVDNTRDEAHVIHKLMNTQGFKSILVVTDPFHSLRTRIIFSDEFRDYGLSAYVRPVRGHWYNAATWWTSIPGWEATINEYARLFAYIFVQRFTR